jgi:hypothetical protein
MGNTIVHGASGALSDCIDWTNRVHVGHLSGVCAHHVTLAVCGKVRKHGDVPQGALSFPGASNPL